MRIAGRVFAVTGGGNGIGREVVLQLVSKGARVAALDIDEVGLIETRSLAANHTANVSTHRVDLTDSVAVKTLVDDVVRHHGQVDGLINVAGIIQDFKPVGEMAADEIHRVMDVNFFGVVNTVTAFLPILMSRPAAAIVNVSSMSAFIAFPGQTIYGASKAAVKLFTEGLYAELRDTPVTVTAVYPGAVDTNILDNSGASAPGFDNDAQIPMTSPAAAAQQIVTGLEKGSYRALIGWDSRGFDVASRVAPKLATDLIASQLGKALNKSVDN